MFLKIYILYINLANETVLIDGMLILQEAQEKIHKKQVARESKKAKLEATEMDENTRRRKGHDEETAKPAEVVEDDASKPKAT